MFTYRKFFYINFLILFCMIIIPRAEASVIMNTPQCSMVIKIISKDNTVLLGEITKVKNQRFFSEPLCKKIKNKNIKITGSRKLDKARLAGVTYLKLGVQTYSSNSPTGAVIGEHWEILKMEIGEAGLVVDPMKYPSLSFELLED